MTEEQAKTKWCPMVRDIGELHYPAGNAAIPYRNPDWARCIGPECALWRRVYEKHGECGLKTRTFITEFTPKTKSQNDAINPERQTSD